MVHETVLIHPEFTWIVGLRVQRVGDGAWSIDVVCPTYGMEIYGYGKSRNLAIANALRLLEAVVKREEQNYEPTGPNAQQQGGGDVREGQAGGKIPFEAPGEARKLRERWGEDIIDG